MSEQEEKRAASASGSEGEAEEAEQEVSESEESEDENAREPAETADSPGSPNAPAAAAAAEEAGPAAASPASPSESGSMGGEGLTEGSEGEGSEESEESETEFMALRREGSQREAVAAAAAAAAPAPLTRQLSQEQEEALLRDSPFLDTEHPVTAYEAAKLVLMLPVVLLKLLVLAVALPYAWAVLWLLLLGHKPQTPMRPFRQFLVRQWVHQWGRFLLFLAGFFYIPVRGWENLREAEACRAILAFNHPSYVDAAAVATFFTPSGVSKAGVASIPFIGLFGIALQLFFVERKGSSDRANEHVLRGDAVDAIAARAADRRFPLIAIAPEATTKAQPCLLKFRRGAFVAGQPVCPVLLRYRFKHFNPGWGLCFTPFHVYRLMAQFVNHLEITVLPPYYPSEAELEDWALYAANVRRLMAERLGVPLVEQGLSEERALWHLGASTNLRGTRVMLPKRRRGKPKAE